VIRRVESARLFNSARHSCREGNFFTRTTKISQQPQVLAAQFQDEEIAGHHDGFQQRFDQRVTTQRQARLRFESVRWWSVNPQQGKMSW
jgi:hypothetical protein